MAPRSTRSKPAPAAGTQSQPSGQATETKLPLRDPNPPHIFLLPKQASERARFVTLRNAASNFPERYLYCLSTGMYELKKMAAVSQDAKRSLLLTGRPPPELQTKTPAYVLQSASILTATPLDPLFLLLPLFESLSDSDNNRVMARTEEDHWETLGNQPSPHAAALLKQADFCNLLRPRLAAVCDVADIDGEEAYRPNLGKLAAELRRKAANMAKQGAWPASLEEAFVRKPLEAPAGAATRASFVRQADSNLSENTVDDLEKTKPDNTETQQPRLVATDEIRHLARLRTAVNLILQSYIPIPLHAPIWACLSSIDFAPLDEHLKAVATLKSEVQALRSLSDNISRKRTGGFEDDEAAEERAEKKRRTLEQEAKRKQESRAMKQLAKADTSGMKKMSSFFTAKAKAT